MDTITWASPVVAEGVITKECLEKGGWESRKQRDHFNVPDKLWRTLIGNRDAHGEMPTSYSLSACGYCLQNLSVNGHLDTRKLLEGRTTPPVKDYVKRVRAVTWNQVFVEISSCIGSKDKLFGLGPAKAQKGDVVCILFGCPVPCVLRHHPRPPSVGGSSYEFIGEAFVYGKMDGEALSALTKGALEKHTTTFKIL